jgi:hypothetical protein
MVVTRSRASATQRTVVSQEATGKSPAVSDSDDDLFGDLESLDSAPESDIEPKPEPAPVKRPLRRPCTSHDKDKAYAELPPSSATLNQCGFIALTEWHHLFPQHDVNLGKVWAMKELCGKARQTRAEAAFVYAHWVDHAPASMLRNFIRKSAYLGRRHLREHPGFVSKVLGEVIGECNNTMEEHDFQESHAYIHNRHSYQDQIDKRWRTSVWRILAYARHDKQAAIFLLNLLHSLYYDKDHLH